VPWNTSINGFTVPFFLPFLPLVLCRFVCTECNVNNCRKCHPRNRNRCLKCDSGYSLVAPHKCKKGCINIYSQLYYGFFVTTQTPQDFLRRVLLSTLHLVLPPKFYICAKCYALATELWPLTLVSVRLQFYHTRLLMIELVLGPDYQALYHIWCESVPNWPIYRHI